MAITFICPACSALIDNSNVNITTNLAQCTNCGAIHKASELVAKEDEAFIAKPPLGSLIELTKRYDGIVELNYPQKGFTASDIPTVFFALFWMIFISFWTFMASSAPGFFALFSIPFWIAGLGMWMGLINGIFETQSLQLARDQITLLKKRPIGTKTITYSLKEIVDIKMATLTTNSFSIFSNANYWSKLKGGYGAK